MKSTESHGKTVELAIEAGLKELNVTRDKVDVEILSEGGIFKKPSVRLTLKRTEGERALRFIEELLEKLGITAFAELKEDEERASINVVGADVGAFIGRGGEVLDAVQYLATVIANKGADGKEFKRISVDGEGYRARRETTLEEIADKLASEALELNRSVSAKPMSSADRRVMHSRLQTNEAVTTFSEGDEPARYIVVVPKGVTPGGHKTYSADRYDDGGRYDNRRGGGVNREGRNFNNGRRDGYADRGGFDRDGRRVGGGDNRGAGYGGGRYADRGGGYDNGGGRAPAEGGQKPAPYGPKKQFAFRSINKRSSPYANRSGFADAARAKSGFSDEALMNKGGGKFNKE